MSNKFLPTEGVALAGYLMAFGLISTLLGKGILTREDADHLIDNQSLMLETFGLSSEDRIQAHDIIEKTRETLAKMTAQAHDIKSSPIP